MIVSDNRFLKWDSSPNLFSGMLHSQCFLDFFSPLLDGSLD